MRGYRTKSSRSHLITPPLTNPSITQTWQEDQRHRNPSASWETTTQIDWNHLHSGRETATSSWAKRTTVTWERRYACYERLNFREKFVIHVKKINKKAQRRGAAFHSNNLNETLNDKANWKRQRRIVSFLDEWHRASDIYDSWVTAAPSIVPFQTHFNNRRLSHIAASSRLLCSAEVEKKKGQ